MTRFGRFRISFNAKVDEDVEISETGDRLITVSFNSGADFTSWFSFEDKTSRNSVTVHVVLSVENKYAKNEGSGTARANFSIRLLPYPDVNSSVEGSANATIPITDSPGVNAKIIDVNVLIAMLIMLFFNVKKRGLTHIDMSGGTFAHRFANLVRVLVEKAMRDVASVVSGVRFIE